jgi:hypothetical protein
VSGQWGWEALQTYQRAGRQHAVQARRHGPDEEAHCRAITVLHRAYSAEWDAVAADAFAGRLEIDRWAARLGNGPEDPA